MACRAVVGGVVVGRAESCAGYEQLRASRADFLLAIFVPTISYYMVAIFWSVAGLACVRFFGCTMYLLLRMVGW